MKGFVPSSNKIGGYTENDGSIDFYSRIQCLIKKDSKVLDYGAGRGAWSEDESIFRRKTRTLKGEVGKLYACDIDEAVLLNKNVDEILKIKNGKVEAPNQFFDLIIADYVLEHIQDPNSFTIEIDRLLKPGGWFCARTPHKYCLISIFASIFKNKLHKSILKYAQPNRNEIDVFPTYYRLNTLKEVGKYFQSYLDKSFIFRNEPTYFFGNKSIYYFQKFMGNFLIDPLVGNLFIYKQKNLND